MTAANPDAKLVLPMAWPTEKRNPVLVFLLLAALLFGGMGLGMRLAEYFAPGSWLAQFVGFLMLPLCLGLGMTAWFTIASSVVITQLGRAAFTSWRRGHTEAEFRSAVRENLVELAKDGPPGTFVFLPVSWSVSAIAALLIALATNTRLPAVATFAVFFFLGAAYGALLWLLARSGWLPIPEEA